MHSFRDMFCDLRPEAFTDTFANVPAGRGLALSREFVPRPLVDDDAHRQLLRLDRQFGWDLRPEVRSSLNNPLTAVVLTDSWQTIQLVNGGFTRMTGYAAGQAVGQKPRFLQGADTDPCTTVRIRECLAALAPFAGQLINYRKNGEKYWCDIHIEPIFDQFGVHTHYLAIEHELALPN